MGVTHAGVLGIDEQGSVVEEAGNNQLRIKLKVVKIDHNSTYTNSGKMYWKIGQYFCTKRFDYKTYNAGVEAVFIDFKVNKNDDTIWILATSDNGYRFYTKVHVIEQR